MARRAPASSFDHQIPAARRLPDGFEMADRPHRKGKIVMKLFAHAILVASPMLAVATDAQTLGRSPEQKIVVTGEQVTLARWSDRVTRQLDRSLRYPAAPFGRSEPSGLVKVRFQCSEDGRPATVTLGRTSGARSLDREAIRAVTNIKSLHPMPEDMRPDQQFEAHIVFALSQADLNRQIAAMKREEASQNRLAASQARPIVVTAGFRARTPVG